MKKILFTAICIFGMNCVYAVFFGLDGYVIEKNNIIKYPKGIYGVYIDYPLKGATKQSLNNNCIIEKDATSMLQPECQKDKSGEFLVTYLKMWNLININNGKTCVLNIMFYDKSDTLLQNSQLSAFENCPWIDITPDTSVDKARDYIIKIEGKLVAPTESFVNESKAHISIESK